jgi:FAD/FMN-containing dehydrogenase
MNDLAALPAHLAEALKAVVGERGLVADAGPYENDGRDMYHGRAAFVVKPASTDEVARVVALLAGARVAIVPQGGNTSLCGGSVPDESGTQVVVNLSRMNRVRDVDAANNTMTVEAGAVLAAIQKVADEHDRLFPLSLGAEGSCEIGGNLSTNAGGTGVLRYGNTRDLVLGLEVVLPDGRVWDGLRALRKDNTGYDLKHLFVGAEGTLGIITAAVLKLYAKPSAIATAFLAVADPAMAIALLARVRNVLGDRVTGFELISRASLEMAIRHIAGTRDPLAQACEWYVLLEIADGGDEARLNAAVEEALGALAEEGLILDAVLAASRAQRQVLWKIREDLGEAGRLDGPSIKHDIAVPVSRVPEMIERGGRDLERAFPGIRVLCFGHAGDGNLHYNCGKPAAQEAAAFFAQQEAVNHVVYEIVKSLNGSISAEHGLGKLKREEIKRYKSTLELELMRSIKSALDPHALMNPGKVL